MTRDDIIRMALEAGGCTPDGGDLWELHENSLVLFYAFAAAEKEARMIRDGYRQCAEGQRTTQYCGLLDAAVKAEREACAKACEAEGERFKHHPSGRRDFSICAAAIRARGET